jgi:general secretion pathway protein M
VNRFIGPVALWYSGRTVRERRMLMVMAGLMTAVIVWLGVIRPVLAWRGDAADRAAESGATLAEVRAGVAALGPPRAPVQAPSEGLDPLVRRTASAAGLDVVIAMSPSGQLGFQLARVRSATLFAWLATLETDHRLTLCILGVVENADATLNVEGSLAVGACAG